MTKLPLWTVEAMANVMRAARTGPLPHSIPGISIDTRTIARGEAFFAIRGDNRDGHDFAAAALEAGGGRAVVAADKRPAFSAGAAVLASFEVGGGLRARA